MAMGETRTIVLSSHMPMDGKYAVDVTLSPPEKPFLDHLFDAKSTTYTVDVNGREKTLKCLGIIQSGCFYIRWKITGM